MFQAKGDTLINLCVSYILSNSIEMPSKRSLVNKKYMPCDMQALPIQSANILDSLAVHALVCNFRQV